MLFRSFILFSLANSQTAFISINSKQGFDGVSKKKIFVFDLISFFQHPIKLSNKKFLMKKSKLLNNLIFQLLLTMVFSIQLIAAESIDIWKGNSEIKIESAESNQINPDDEKKSLFEERQIVKTNIFQVKNEDLDFNKVYGLFDPEENDLSLEIWIESDGKILLEQLKRIETINLSKDSEELLIKILFTNSYLPVKNINSSDFLDYKLEWLIKNDKVNIMEEFLSKNTGIEK